MKSQLFRFEIKEVNFSVTTATSHVRGSRITCRSRFSMTVELKIAGRKKKKRVKISVPGLTLPSLSFVHCLFGAVKKGLLPAFPCIRDATISSFQEQNVQQYVCVLVKVLHCIEPRISEGVGLDLYSAVVSAVENAFRQYINYCGAKP